MRYFKLFFVILLPLLLVLSSCQLEEPEQTQTVTDLKGNNISRYVALGNSLTAGVQSGSLMEDFQQFSFPNLIAKQLGISQFAQPTVSYPGMPALLELDPATGSLFSPAGIGQPTNATYGAPYNNLGIPTATVWDILHAIDSTTNYRYYFFGETNPAVNLVLRNPALGNTSAFQQAKMQQPQLITLWIGNNDVLGNATSGGLKPITPLDDFVHPVTGMPMQGFVSSYNELIDSVAALGCWVALANIPDVTAPAFFKVVGPAIADSFTVDSIPSLAFEKGTDDLNTGMATGQATVDNLNNFDVLVTLVGGSYASLIGQPTGKWYRDLAVRYGMDVSTLLAAKYAAVDTTQLFGLHPQNPWPSALILDQEEIALIKQVTAAYNQVIAAAAANHGFALFDANAFLNEISDNNGISMQGYYFTPEFATGGLFSLDGIHLSNAGYAIVANKFIEAINNTYNVAIAPVPLRDVLGHAPVKKTSAVSLDQYDLNSMAPVLEMFGGAFWK